MVVLGHPTSQETPYLKGVKSGKDSWRDQKNPFPPSSWEHARWEDGYKDGLKERKPNDPYDDYFFYC